MTQVSQNPRSQPTGEAPRRVPADLTRETHTEGCPSFERSDLRRPGELDECRPVQPNSVTFAIKSRPFISPFETPSCSRKGTDDCLVEFVPLSRRA